MIKKQILIRKKSKDLQNFIKCDVFTPDKISKKIKVLLDAKKKNLDGGEEDDYTAIDKGLKHATAIHGIIPQGGGDGVKNTYNFIFSPEVQSKVRDINEDIKKILRKGNDQKN